MGIGMIWTFEEFTWKGIPSRRSGFRFTELDPQIGLHKQFGSLHNSINEILPKSPRSYPVQRFQMSHILHSGLTDDSMSIARLSVPGYFSLYATLPNNLQLSVFWAERKVSIPYVGRFHFRNECPLEFYKFIQKNDCKHNDKRNRGSSSMQNLWIFLSTFP